jgi:amino acid transporter
MLLWLLDPYDLLIFLLAFIVLIIGILIGISSYREGRKIFKQHWRSRATPINLYLENGELRNKHIIIGSILVPIGFITLYIFQSNGSLNQGTGFLGFIIWRSGALLVGFGITIMLYAWLFSKKNL